VPSPITSGHEHHPLARPCPNRQNSLMNFNDYHRERRSRWQRFSALLDQVDQKGPGSLGPRESDEFFSLYRLTSSDLNLVQTRTANPSLVDYLEGLVARGYAQLFVPRPASFFRG